MFGRGFQVPSSSSELLFTVQLNVPTICLLEQEKEKKHFFLKAESLCV